MFPLSTCERSAEGGVAQPWSAAANAITCLTLLGLACVARTTPVRILLGTFALFEAWHAFSHAEHIPGAVQADVVHVLGYFMSFATLHAILRLSSRRRLSAAFVLAASLAIIADLFVWLCVKGVWTFFTGLSVLAVIVFGNRDKLPTFFRACLPFLASGLLLLFGLFLNESVNCERMMRFKVLPYHLLVEGLGFALFIALALLFLRWERTAP